MHSAPVVITVAIVALVVIYFMPWFDERVRKQYSRWRRKQRDLREERMRRDRFERQ